MIRKIVEIRTIENVKEFVNMISKTTAEADLASMDRRHVVDAKSILGVFSLNIVGPLELRIFDDAENAWKYREIFDKFACETA